MHLAFLILQHLYIISLLFFRFSMIMEPLMLIVAFLLFFFFAFIYVRLDFSISKVS